MPQLYTPFLGDVTGKIGSALLGAQSQRQTRALTESAYMGDPEAMARLVSVNPQAAAQVQQMTRQREQDRLSAASRETGMEDRRAMLFDKNRQRMTGIMQEAAKLGSFEEAKAFTDREQDNMLEAGIIDEAMHEDMELTPETFSQIKARFGEQPEQVGALDQARIDKINAEIEAMAGTDSKEALQIKKLMLDIQKKQQDIAAGPKKTAEETRKSGFYQRMISSQKEIDLILEESPNFEVSAFSETGPAALGNIFASTEFQKYKQAADDWIRSKLRWESGAVISEGEMIAEYENYFPIFGDSKKVIEQKRRARRTAEKAMSDGKATESTVESQAVTTQAEFDALPSGATYTEDGVEYRKP